ncbi:methyl-accepting chemotaxis protein [Bdellovibrio sp. HCB209]|uniref:methyl-accepting chemotaxis protein n=1 Tax=Bdellovibrio sp. HCB209 TaxID=3394354 RepID=UPI0039B51F73
MKFSTRVLLSVAVGCAMCVGLSIYISSHQIDEIGSEDLAVKSRAILSRLEVVRSYIAQQGGLEDLVQKMVEKYPDGQLPKEAKLEVLKRVPIFASMKVGEEGADKEHYKFRVFSDEPRNSQNMASATEMEVFKRFAADVNLPEVTTMTDETVTVYRPVRLSEAQGCMVCHGDPATSPWKNGKDILGHQMENWRDGKLHGVLAISSERAEVKAAGRAASMKILMFAGIFCFVVIGAVALTLRKPLAALMEVIQELTDSGEKVSNASVEISKASQNLSASATQAAASIETTSASTEEVSSMISMNSSNANEAKNLSGEAQVRAAQGKSQVQNLIVSMNEIASSSKKIEEITNVIDDIAFQTNLLALNAAVEAARAGEQGKGFSVVAEAVRALAQRSAISAKEITELIKDSVGKINHGCEVARDSGEALNQIVNTVEKVNQLNTEVSAASAEQSQGISAINASITQLDKVTQSNAAVAEESAAAAEELCGQSKKLHGLVTSLNEFVEGRKAA